VIQGIIQVRLAQQQGLGRGSGIADRRQPVGEGKDHQRYTRSRTTPKGLASYESAES
jgi:hypothetical protein